MAERKIDLIKSLNIASVAERLGVKLGRNLKELICPLCSNKKPRFGLNTDKNVFNCFHCKEGGGNFQLVEALLECKGDYKRVYNWFDENFNTNSHEPPRIEYKYVPSSEKKQSSKIDGAIFHDIYSDYLELLQDLKPSNYLPFTRRIAQEELEKNNVKSAIYDNDEARRFDEKKAFESGLKFVSKKGYSCWTFEHVAYVAPIYRDNKIVMLQGRAAQKSADYPAYRFLAGIKKPSLYIPEQEKSDHYFICEGMITSWAFLTDGLPAIALLSKHYREDEVIQELQQFKSKELMLSPDIDGSGGVQAMKKLKGILTSNGFKVNAKMFNVKQVARAEGLDDKNITDYADILQERKNND